MKNIFKFISYICIFTISIFICTFEIKADKYQCNFTSNDTCTKKTYKYNANGDVQSVSITLGAYHFKRSDSSANNEQYIVTNAACSGEKCNGKTLLKVIESSKISIQVNSKNEVFPKAVCAVVGNQYITDENIKDYLYFTDEEIKNSKCDSQFIVYAEGKKEESKVCNKSIGSFYTNTEYSLLKLSTLSYSEGYAKCRIEVKNSSGTTEFSFVNSHYSSTCDNSSYSIKCKDIGDPTAKHKRLCNVYECEKPSGNVAGMKCTLYNEKNQNDTIIVNIADNKYVKNKNEKNSYTYSIVKNGSFVKRQSSWLDTNEGVKCPDYVYNTNGVYTMVDETLRVRYENEKGNSIKEKYVLKSTSDLYESEINENGMPNEYVNYPEEKEPFVPVCGIFGENSWNYVQTFYDIIRIAIPALIILLGMLDFIKVLFSGEEKDMKAAGQKFAKRIIAGVVFLLLPVLLDFIFGIVGFSENCLGKFIG